jgi:hypothetical protein
MRKSLGNAEEQYGEVHAIALFSLPSSAERRAAEFSLSIYFSIAHFGDLIVNIGLTDISRKMSPRAVNNTNTKDAQHMDEEQRSHAMQPSSSTKGERRVTFYGRVRVVDIPDCSDLADEHRASLWYSHNELLGLRANQKSTIELMVAGTEIPIDDKIHCSDGLHTPDEHDLRKVYSLEALHEVLMEQQLQWDDDVLDPEMIADVYFECTCHSQLQAMERGAQHARIVEELNRPLKKLGEIYEFQRSRPKFTFPRTSCLLGGEERAIVEASLSSVVDKVLDLVGE